VGSLKGIEFLSFPFGWDAYENFKLIKI